MPFEMQLIIVGSIASLITGTLLALFQHNLNQRQERKKAELEKQRARTEGLIRSATLQEIYEITRRGDFEASARLPRTSHSKFSSVFFMFLMGLGYFIFLWLLYILMPLLAIIIFSFSLIFISYKVMRKYLRKVQPS